MNYTPTPPPKPFRTWLGIYREAQKIIERDPTLEFIRLIPPPVAGYFQQSDVTINVRDMIRHTLDEVLNVGIFSRETLGALRSEIGGSPRFTVDSRLPVAMDKINLLLKYDYDTRT